MMVNSYYFMSETFPTYPGFIDYPISKLEEFVPFHEHALMELVVDDYGNGDYVNRKTEISTFFDFLISSHPIFNKIDDVYNDKTYPEVNDETNVTSYRYAADIYISGQTYFKTNPYSYDSSAYALLSDNQTVQKRQLEKFIHDNTLEINTIGTDDTCVQYGEYGWYKSSSDYDNPRIDTLTFVPFKKTSRAFEIQNNKNDETGIPLNHSINPFKLFSNSFATIVGKLKLKPYPIMDKDAKQTPYYSVENNIWVGIWSEGNVVAISELHNYDGNTAFFSFQMPLTRDTEYYIVTPIDVDENIDDIEDVDEESHDMFCNIYQNTAAIFYYSQTPSKEMTTRPPGLFD